MSFRFWINGSFVFGFSIVVGYMLRQENLDPVVVETTVEHSDRIVKLGISYRKDDRAKNFINFGMDSTMIDVADKKLLKWDKKRAKVKQLLQDAYNNQDLHEHVETAFCIRNPLQRPRYYAAIFLLKRDKEGKVGLVNLKRMTELEYQDWTETIPFQEIYKKLEIRAVTPTDTTIMFAAALFAKKAGAILKEEAPWGAGNNWSWGDVKKQYRNLSIDMNVTQYMALMHLFTEVAQEPQNRICVSE